MRFSLIVATVDRVSDLETLLNALNNQTFKDFEVIIVDQNDDDRLGPIVDAFCNDLNMRRLLSSVRNNSHARNLGLLIANGDLIAFPDDDCLYPPQVLASVDEAFRADPELAFLTGPSLSPEGRLGSGRWHRTSGPITMHSVWTSITEFNFFLRADWAAMTSGFDEAFGLGARFGSAEGVEMVLRIMKQGGRGFYDFDLKVVHPDKGFTHFTASRAFQYGTGLGRVLRKHRVSVKSVLPLFARPIGGIIINLLRFKYVAAKFHWQALCGRLYGFFSNAGARKHSL